MYGASHVLSSANDMRCDAEGPCASHALDISMRQPWQYMTCNLKITAQRQFVQCGRAWCIAWNVPGAASSCDAEGRAQGRAAGTEVRRAWTSGRKGTLWGMHKHGRQSWKPLCNAKARAAATEPSCDAHGPCTSQGNSLHRRRTVLLSSVLLLVFFMFFDF